MDQLLSSPSPVSPLEDLRDFTTVTEGTETVLDDPETAQYTHNLTGRLPGLYRCTVFNNKPSSASRGVRVDGTILILSHTLFGTIP